VRCLMRDVWVVVKGCHTCVLLKLILLPQLYVLLTPARPACPLLAARTPSGCASTRLWWGRAATRSAAATKRRLAASPPGAAQFWV
jgi:hypothetical protein